MISDALLEVNAILAPAISELSEVRNSSSDFSGLDGVEGKRFHHEIERLGEFLVDYVISGELVWVYAETAN
jgi:hypothetical protein